MLHNLDDGNQYMIHFPEWDINARPSLSLEKGRLPILTDPGLGFEIDRDAVARVHALFAEREG